MIVIIQHDDVNHGSLQVPSERTYEKYGVMSEFSKYSTIFINLYLFCII